MMWAASPRTQAKLTWLKSLTKKKVSFRSSIFSLDFPLFSFVKYIRFLKRLWSMPQNKHWFPTLKDYFTLFVDVDHLFSWINKKCVSVWGSCAFCKRRRRRNIRVTNYATKKQHIIILGPGAQWVVTRVIGNPRLGRETVVHGRWRETMQGYGCWRDSQNYGSRLL